MFYIFSAPFSTFSLTHSDLVPRGWDSGYGTYTISVFAGRHHYQQESSASNGIWKTATAGRHQSWSTTINHHQLSSIIINHDQSSSSISEHHESSSSIIKHNQSAWIIINHHEWFGFVWFRFQKNWLVWFGLFHTLVMITWAIVTRDVWQLLSLAVLSFLFGCYEAGGNLYFSSD